MGGYRGVGNRNINFLSKVLTVRGAGAANCIIDGEGVGRGISITDIDNTLEVVLEGLSIINGQPGVADPLQAGGGIYIKDAVAVIQKCRFINNQAEEGGAIFIFVSHPPPPQPYPAPVKDYKHKPRIINCLFADNQAERRGGAMCFEGVVVPYGLLCEPQVVDCVFENNRSQKYGGGLCVKSGAKGMIDRCEFLGNHALLSGGGICLNDPIFPGNAKLTNSIFVGNRADTFGGALARSQAGGDLDVRNCTICQNVAGIYGGGIYNYFTDKGPIDVNGSILWGNTQSDQAIVEAQLWGAGDVYYSCIMDEDPNDDQIPFSHFHLGNINDNIDDDPLFVRDPNDGGDGWGVGGNDDYGDLHLLRDSPCYNRGEPALGAMLDERDFDGEPRIMDGEVDMGADEIVMSQLAVTKPAGGVVWEAR